jgi:hypothetical protein
VDFSGSNTNSATHPVVPRCIRELVVCDRLLFTCAAQRQTVAIPHLGHWGWRPIPSAADAQGDEGRQPFALHQAMQHQEDHALFEMGRQPRRTPPALVVEALELREGDEIGLFVDDPG